MGTPDVGARVEEKVARLRLDGWCVLEDVIPPDKADAVRASVESTATTHGSVDDRGVATRKGLLAFDQSFAPYLADQRLLGIAEQLLGPHFRVSFTTVHMNLPGNTRGHWHADWPFNQQNAGHVPAPYPDVVMHLTTLWMLSPFTEENGGTFVVPGSHRSPNNPSGDNGVDPYEPYPTEMQAEGEAGSVLLFDSRLWHATAPNRSDRPRVGMPVRFAPWWLNLNVLRPGSPDRSRLLAETGRGENEGALVPPAIYDGLPATVKPLFQHWVEE
ncbi:MAG: phytanoyl-CoA dioxygenase [Dehalococcoidia bacterium]|nr:phytanoyl-CoA dioxygenase [Dehalococcoidia bacterium]